MTQRVYKMKIEDPQQEKNESLLIAAGTGLVETFKNLVADGANINYKNTSGQDVLFMATHHNQPDIVKLVLEDPKYLSAKEDINHQLLLAAQFGFVDVFNSMIKNGADVNFSDEKGKNVLLIACENGHEDIVSAAFDAGFKINDTQLAEQNNQLEQMAQLIEAGYTVPNPEIRPEFYKLSQLHDFNEDKPALSYPKNIEGLDSLDETADKILQDIIGIRKKSSNQSKSSLKNN